MQKKRTFFILVFATLFSACASQPEVVKIAPREQMRLDNTLGRGWVQNFDKGLSIYKNREVAAYFEGLIESLSNTVTDLQETRITLKLVSGPKIKFRTYALPGVVLYLSTDFVKHADLESELAAAVAFELSNVLNRHFVKKVIAKNGGEPKGSLNVQPGDDFLELTEEEMADSLEDAVKMLYSAHFDPRGILAFVDFYRSNPGILNLNADALTRIEDRVRARLVQFTPLRNPVVRSDEFLQMKKNLDKRDLEKKGTGKL